MRWGEASATKSDPAAPVAEDTQPLNEASFSSDSMPAAEEEPTGVEGVGTKAGNKQETFLQKIGLGYQRDNSPIVPSGRSNARFAWMGRFEASAQVLIVASSCGMCGCSWELTLADSEQKRCSRDPHMNMFKHWLLSRSACVRTLNLKTIDQGHPSPRRHGWAMAFICGCRHLGKQQNNSELFYALDHERSSTCAGLHKVQEAPRRRMTEVQRCMNPLCLFLEARLQCRSIQGLWFRLVIDSLCGASD